MSKHSKQATVGIGGSTERPRGVGGLEMSRLASKKQAIGNGKPSDDSLIDGGDVTDDAIDSEGETLPFDDEVGVNTTTTSVNTTRRCETEEEEDDDDDGTTVTAAGATTAGTTPEDDDDDDDDEDEGTGKESSGKKRKRKRKKRRGDDALLIASTRDKKPQQLQRNGQFSNSAASMGRAEEDGWSKDLERDTPSPNLDESKKNWETRCILIIIVIIISVVAAIFVFFLTGQSKGETMIDFRFANYLSSHVVLQGAPQRAVVWGYGPKPWRDEEVIVAVRMYKTSSTSKVNHSEPTPRPSFEYQTKVISTAAGNTWKVIVGPVSEQGPFRIIASLEGRSGARPIRLEDVLFGDVWVCSGHDRLHDNISKIINSSDDEPPSSSPGDDDLRIFSVFPAKSDIPWFDIHVVDINWSIASRSSLPRIRDRGGHLSPRFPAACWLFGQYLRRKLGKPVGLVAATYGDSSVEEWSPSKVIDSCLLDYADGTSRIWNGMIHPLLDMQVKGLIWQQGNFFGEGIAANYSCSLKEFLNDWRAGIQQRIRGSEESEVSPLPIGILQMLPMNYSKSSAVESQLTAQMRWLATDSYGFLPNIEMESTFLVVTIDLPDPEDMRQKKVMAERLLKGSSHVAYKMKVEFQGPIPLKYVAVTQNSLALTFDDEVEVRNNSGFEICCSKNRNLMCQGESSASGSFWTESPLATSSKSTLTLSGSNCPWNIVGFRYAWSDSPCQFLRCPVYSKQSGLPMPPFISLGLTDDGFVRDLDRVPVTVW